jgi:hypothetical protein
VLVATLTGLFEFFDTPTNSTPFLEIPPDSFELVVISVGEGIDTGGIVGIESISILEVLFVQPDQQFQTDPSISGRKRISFCCPVVLAEGSADNGDTIREMFPFTGDVTPSCDFVSVIEFGDCPTEFTWGLNIIFGLPT